MLLGEETLLKLRDAVIVVAGLGGVGAYAAEMVARAGVGRMVLIDSDRVGESNKNRQLLALDSTLGRLKTEVMVERLLDINPELHIVKVRTISQRCLRMHLGRWPCAEALTLMEH